MNYVITLTPCAKADLSEIFKYITADLQSVQNASEQLDRLEKAIVSLAQMPERFRIYGKTKWHERNLRIMPVDNYPVFYIPEHEKNTVTVVRVIYSGRDVDRQLKKESAKGRFSACGGSPWRHFTLPPQCAPARRAFDIIGKFIELSYDTKYSKFICICSL